VTVVNFSKECYNVAMLAILANFRLLKGLWRELAKSKKEIDQRGVVIT